MTRLFTTLGLQKSNGVKLPGTKADQKQPEEEAASAADGSLCRSGAGAELFIAGFRPETMFAAKEAARGMASPTDADLSRVKKLARFLRTTESWALHLFPNEGAADKVDGYSDADWATDPERGRAQQAARYSGQARWL